MVGMTKIPCSVCSAALQKCDILAVFVTHHGAQWPCATIQAGVNAGVLGGLPSWHTGVNLACRLGDKGKIMLLGFDVWIRRVG